MSSIAPLRVTLHVLEQLIENDHVEMSGLEAQVQDVMV